MRSLRIALIVVGITLGALPGVAVAQAADTIDSDLEGTDLRISYPKDWVRQAPDADVDFIRAFVALYPDVSAQVMGVTPSDSDEELLIGWKSMFADALEIARSPDNDTVTTSLQTGRFPRNLVAWRASENANAKQLHGRLLTVKKAKVGRHPAYTSLVKLRDYPVLLGTLEVEQPGGRYLVVTTAVDLVDRKINDAILASMRTR